MYPSLLKTKITKACTPINRNTCIYLPPENLFLALSNFKASHIFLNLMLHIYDMQSLFKLTTELTYRTHMMLWLIFNELIILHIITLLKRFTLIKHRHLSMVQMVPNLECLRLHFFDFMVMPKWHTLNRSHTCPSGLSWSHRHQWDALWWRRVGAPHLPVGHPVLKMDHRYTHNHSVFYFQYSTEASQVAQW